MRVKVLGAPEIGDGALWRSVTAGRCRAVLGSLVAHAPYAVSVDQVVDDVWDQRPPDSAPTQVYGYVRKLRQMLGDPDGAVLHTGDGGYQLSVGPLGIDAHRFESAVRAGLDTIRGGGLEEACAVLEEALSWWRGEPFGGAPAGCAARAMATRLENLRVTAVEHLLQARIDRGQHAAVIDELYDQIGRHPFREHLWRQLLVALQRSGREAEALCEYDRLRHLLADELGTDPSCETRTLHQQILAGSAPRSIRPAYAGAAPPEPATALVSTEAVAPGDAPVRQLPPTVADFTGRVAERRALRECLEHDPATVDAPAVVVVRGAPGTGKSALALHVARAVRDRYPDAQFHLDLAGTSGRPRDPAELLATMLQALGRGRRTIPDHPEERAALVRSLLDERRVLLVLDDADCSAQIRPLLPPGGRSAVVVTSRRTLTDLAGARHLQLGPLEPDDAEGLLTRMVGRARVERERAEARAIVRLCGHLPLAVRIAGGRLLARPSWPLRQLRVRLADETRRLSELSLGDLDLRAAIDRSLRALPPEAVAAFLRLGASPGEPAADVDADELLVDAGLVEPAGHDPTGRPRYRMYELLRIHAREQALVPLVGPARAEEFARLQVLHADRGRALVGHAPGS